MISKKTFEAVAAQFAKSKPEPMISRIEHPRDTYRLKGRHVQWENDVVVIADVFAAENPHFDRIRFYRACGVEVAKRRSWL